MFLVVSLAVLAVLQLAGVIDGGAEFGSPLGIEAVSVGDDLSSVPMQYSDGTVSALDPTGPMILLIFDPDCVHSGRVAPLWSSWLASGGKTLSVLAVAPGPVTAALAYAKERQWPVRVASPRGGANKMEGQTMMRRTPWVFAVDSAGRVVSEAHGSKVAEVARSLLDNS